MRPVLVLAGSAAGCGLLANSDGTELDPLRLQIAEEETVTDGDGLVFVDIDVPASAAHFQVTGDSDLYVSLERLLAPDGTVVLDYADWISSERSLTLAFFAERTTVAFDWSVRDVDGPLEAGVWTAVLATTDYNGYYTPFTPINVTRTLKFDPSFTDGSVSVQIVYARDVDADVAVVAAIEGAVARWEEIWAARGVTLVVEYLSSDLPPNLGFTYTGSEAVESLARRKAPEQLQLVIGETVAGESYTFGVSAGIPGTLQPTPNTFVVLAWLVHAGVDGAFDPDEVRLMGETMAHETGHYMGLFHPVESYFDTWDALDDTPECSGSSTCEDQLGANLMFPYPVCGGEGCVPQGDVTAQQARVMHQYAGAL